MTIKDISFEYDPIAGKYRYSRGDTITGRVVLELSKDTKIERLSVTAKAKASVFWTEHHIYAIVSYKSKEKFFYIEKFLLEDSRPGSKVLAAGRHVFPFAFDIPDVALPPMWAGRHGRISYSLETRASRSWKLDRKANTIITIVSSQDYSNLDLMKPQEEGSQKKGLFSSGNTALNVRTKKMGYLPGEGLEVTSQIVNNTKDTVTPRYVLYEKQSFFTKNKRKVHTKNILEEKGQPVLAGTQLIDTKVLQIPEFLEASILNCSIIKLEYKLKVFLDGPLYSPEVKLPIVVLTQSERLQGSPQ